MAAVAKVLDPVGSAGCVRGIVRAASEGALVVELADGCAVDARVVLGLPVAPRAGDVVLCVCARVESGRAEHYVLAVVSALRAAPEPDRALTVEHDDGRSVVRLPRGHVRFEADGDLELASTGTVRVEGARIEARAHDADVTLDRAVLRARRWESVIARASQTFEVLETRASRIVQRAKDVFHEVEDLAQTHAGRVRVVADDAVHVHARRALIKADEDVKLRGEKIHLG
jgi:hypothetical protein